MKSDSSAGPLTVAAIYHISQHDSPSASIVTLRVHRPLVSAKIFFSCEKSLSFMNIALLGNVIPVLAGVGPCCRVTSKYNR